MLLRVFLIGYVLYPAVQVAGTSYDGIIRPTGDGRYEAYMIVPNKSNHASFLEHLSSGDFVMAWFSGVKEGASNCSIAIARLAATGSRWSPGQVVSWRVGYSNQNPVLFEDNTTGILHLFHSQQPASSTVQLQVGSEDHAQVWELTDTSGTGLNWTKPQLLFSKYGSFDRNRIILSLTGAWLFPMYYAGGSDSEQHSILHVSKDHKTWDELEYEDSGYLVQPSVIRPKADMKNLITYFRDRRAEWIYEATSTDDGEKWSKPSKTKLPNNNSGIEATVLQSGNIAIMYNPTHNERYPLRISLSEDEGKTWRYSRDLETGHSGNEFSYPTILQSADGYIHVSYTYNRDTIKYVKFKEDWIKGQ